MEKIEYRAYIKIRVFQEIAPIDIHRELTVAILMVLLHLNIAQYGSGLTDSRMGERASKTTLAQDVL